MSSMGDTYHLPEQTIYADRPSQAELDDLELDENGKPLPSLLKPLLFGAVAIAVFVATTQS